MMSIAFMASGNARYIELVYDKSKLGLSNTRSNETFRELAQIRAVYGQNMQSQLCLNQTHMRENPCENESQSNSSNANDAFFLPGKFCQLGMNQKKSDVADFQKGSNTLYFVSKVYLLCGGQ